MLPVCFTFNYANANNDNSNNYVLLYAYTYFIPSYLPEGSCLMVSIIVVVEHHSHKVAHGSCRAWTMGRARALVSPRSSRHVGHSTSSRLLHQAPPRAILPRALVRCPISLPESQRFASCPPRSLCGRTALRRDRGELSGWAG